MGICGSSPKDDPSLDQQTTTGTHTDTHHTIHTGGIQQGQGQTASPTPVPAASPTEQPTHTIEPSQVHIIMTDAKTLQIPQTSRKSIEQQPVEKPIPEENELNQLFEEFMEGKLFKPEARKTMRALPPVAKWKLLCQEGAAQTNVHDTPGHWAQILRGKSVTRKDLASLRVVLRGQGKQWMTTFVEEGGLTSLLACLSKDNPGDGVIAETLHCLKAFMNNEYGLSVVISAATAVDQVALVLITGNDEMRIQVVDLLAVICWISDKGHRTVMEALRNPRFHRRFELFVKVLQQPQENIELKTRFLTFINAIINAVNDLKDRVAIRREFLDLNFMLALENLHVLVDKHRGDNYDRVAQLAAQMDLFEQVMSGDKRDTSMRDVDLSDPEAVFHVVKHNVIQDGFTAQFANTLHLLMTIPGEPEIGERIWNNVNYVVHKAVIKTDANGRRDDEAAANLTYEELKMALEEKEKQDAIDSVGRTKNLNDQIEHQRQHIHELTMKTTALEEQIQALRAGGAVPAAPGSSSSAPAAPPMAPDMGGGAPAAPPMAPDMGAPAAPPMAPDMGAPAAPPMAPDMGAPAAPPMAPGAPPMAPGAPGAPPMAPGGIWGAAAAAASVPTLPKKKNNKPAQQMRPFHWGVVNPIDVEKSVWKEWSDEKVKLDVAGLEMGFSAAAFKNAPTEKLPGQASGGHSSSHKKETISLIDPKRAYAVNIALARFKMTHRAMRDALLAMDEKTLDEDKLSALLAVAPTQEEIDSVRDYDGDDDSLGQAEQFFRTIAAVPRVRTRIEVLLFKKRFENSVSEIEASLALCENALRNIRGSKSLKTVFEYVLAIGNYLNGGTAKGGAYGFKLDTLNKLKNTRAADGKQTLLHFLTIQIAKQNARGFLEDLKILPDAARVEYNGLQADINKTRGLMSKLKTELDQSDKSANDRFYSVMNQFYDIANRRTQKLGDRLKALDNEAVFIAEQFAESPDKFRMDDIISLFNIFCTDYREAEIFLEKQREEAALEAKRSAQKELRAREQEEKKIRAVAGDPKANEGKLVDAIMDQLSSKDSRDIMQAIRMRRKQGSVANPSDKNSSEQGKITFGAQLKPLYSKK